MENARQPVTAYLGLGSNLGNREANLEEAIRRLGSLGTVTSRSDVVESKPWGYTEQPDYLNMVVALETSLPPRELLKALKSAEVEMGREPTFRYGPRLIDVDILLYGDETVEAPGLTIPHPRMANRPFVMGPLSQIAPEVADRLGGR